ncbi:MAG: hypothetical protein ABIJ34_01650 [archaeon]
MTEKEIKEHKPKKLHEHLKQKVPVPVYMIGAAILLVLLLFVIKIPYQAKESYIEIEKYEEQVTVMKDYVVNEEVCKTVPSEIKISENTTYARAFGLSGFKCYAKFKLWNQENTLGEWTIKYAFNVNGKEFLTEPVTKKIPALAAVEFSFELEDTCKSGDSVSGDFVIVSSPTTEICLYQDVTKQKPELETIQKERNVNKERLVPKTESVFQLLLGVNKGEKA